MRLSPTSVAVFRQCPQQYKFRYIDKLAEQYRKATPYLTMANHVHATLKELLFIENAELRTPAAAKELLTKEWRTSLVGFKDAADEKRWFDKAWRQVEALVLSPYVKATPIMVEAPVAALVSPGVMLYGRVDRVDQQADGSVHIIDYKTGKTPAEVSWTQLQLQALILSIAASASVGLVSFLYLEGCHMITREMSAAELDETRWELLGVASRIRCEKRHLPRPGSWCEHCDFVPICSPSMKEAAASGPAGQLALGEGSLDDI